MIWSYDHHLVTLDTFLYESERYPILKTEISSFEINNQIAYLDGGKDDIFSLIRKKVIADFKMEFDVKNQLKDNHAALLRKLIDLI